MLQLVAGMIVNNFFLKGGKCRVVIYIYMVVYISKSIIITIIIVIICIMHLIFVINNFSLDRLTDNTIPIITDSKRRSVLLRKTEYHNYSL